jgi:Acetyl-coenzyme A synthetase N-terminus
MNHVDHTSERAAAVVDAGEALWALVRGLGAAKSLVLTQSSVTGPRQWETMSPPIWTPESGRTQAARWTAFLQFVNDKYGAGSGDCAALHDWSVGNPEAFWRSVWEFCEVIGEAGGVALSDGSKMPGARWFPEARLNFAENLLRLRDRSDALVFWGGG